MRVNPAMAIRYACTQHAQDLVYGSVSHARWIWEYLRKVFGDNLVAAWTHESDTSVKLGRGGRLISGWKATDEADELPAGLAHEYKVIESLTGLSLNTAPAEIRVGFLVGVRGTREGDLDAAYQQAILKRYPNAALSECREFVKNPKVLGARC